MGSRPKLLVLFLLAGLGLGWLAALRPSVATLDERIVIKAALADPQFPSRCIQAVTSPDHPSSGYGFSNGGSVAAQVWLDRSFSAAQGRDVTLLTDGAEETGWKRFLPAPLRSAACRFPVTLHTPVFQRSLAFVGFGNKDYFGLIALERDGAGWKLVSITRQRRGPVI